MVFIAVVLILAIWATGEISKLDELRSGGRWR